MVARSPDHLHHVILILLSLVVAALLYRFATVLIGGLPWPSVLP
jgi:hypothetical protein